MSDQNITVEVLSFSLAVADLEDIQIKPAPFGGHQLTAKTVQPNFVISIGSILWIGTYLDLTSGEKQ